MKLINAALNQYSLYGYYGASLRKIAEEVGIKPASIYFFYENKETLFISAFQHLLDNHFKKIESTVNENKNKTVNEIMLIMLHGMIDLHKKNSQGTNAYISLVATPTPKFKKYLNNHMSMINDWLVESLGATLKSNYPLMPSNEVERVIKQWFLISNGVFWGAQLYIEEDFNEQVKLAEQMINSLTNELGEKYLC